jgi:hypothetical protein
VYWRLGLLLRFYACWADCRELFRCTAYVGRYVYGMGNGFEVGVGDWGFGGLRVLHVRNFWVGCFSFREGRGVAVLWQWREVGGGCWARGCSHVMWDDTFIWADLQLIPRIEGWFRACVRSLCVYMGYWPYLSCRELILCVLGGMLWGRVLYFSYRTYLYMCIGWYLLTWFGWESYRGSPAIDGFNFYGLLGYRPTCRLCTVAFYL